MSTLLDIKPLTYFKIKSYKTYICFFFFNKFFHCISNYGIDMVSKVEKKQNRNKTETALLHSDKMHYSKPFVHTLPG